MHMLRANWPTGTSTWRPDASFGGLDVQYQVRQACKNIPQRQPPYSLRDVLRLCVNRYLGPICSSQQLEKKAPQSVAEVDSASRGT